ncbi:MAG: sialate O-acetylesterase [Cyclobacteriaceae bacterium]|nr:sialate O-acetylesterase [Cyclobacteriaceae bacterium]
MKIILSALLFYFGCLNSGTEVHAQVRLPLLVGDSMVVQRDTKLKIWGWAQPGEKVKVSFIGKNYTTLTGADGKWNVLLAPIKAGGPYVMEIKASNTIILSDILAGDVWLCAGQSNMVHTLELHKERYASEIEHAHNPAIRNFTVPTATNLNGRTDDITGGKWLTANPKDVTRFSVVAYFFAKKLYEQYRVPIGIINASVGGTPIEAWTSEEGLQSFPQHAITIQKNKDTTYVNVANRAAREANQLRIKKNTDDKGLTEPKVWYDTTYVPKAWRTINIPGYWEDQGIRNFDGVVWYRREIDLPATVAGLSAKVALGRIVDADYMYINGVLIGSTSYQYPQRRYSVPAGLLKAGKNILVVRVINNGGKGGFVPDKPYYLSAGDNTIDLKGYWQYKVGEVYERSEPGVNGIAAQNQPTALFNAMIAPVTNYAVKGVVWYQGESNAGRAEEYRQLLPALIADWRKQWQQSNLPFLYAQLPNFMDVNYSPEESGWATVRDAQLRTLRVPNTGMAVTIDLGEWNDIHPGNKKPVGERLALAAQKVAYGDIHVVSSGPLYKSHKVVGNKIVISFSDAGSGLLAIDGEELHHFAIAGVDKKFVWANALLDNGTVVVWSDKILEPHYVRYAWADNPQGANLYNREGLPASPFTTEQLNR